MQAAPSRDWPGRDKVAMQAAPGRGSLVIAPGSDSAACARALGSIPDSLPLLTSAQRARFGPAATERIAKHEICVGMTREEVKASWGLPATMAVHRNGIVRYAEWYYEKQVVFLKDDIVTGLR